MINLQIVPIFGLDNIQTFKKGGRIYIKKKNRGKFTKSAKAAGESVQEHAAKVLSDPNATPLQKKRANFARNAAKWKHQQGGTINMGPKKKLSIEEQKQVTNKVPKEKGMSGADPIGSFAVETVALNPAFKYIGKGVKFLGKKAYDQYKLNKAIGPKFDKSKLGRMIGRGVEQRVYDGGNGIVYKVYGRANKNSTKQDLKNMKDFYELRNTSPANLPVKYVGYIKNNHNQYLSVFEQPKAEIPTDFRSFDIIVRDGKKRLKDLGYKHWVDYRNADHDLIDVHPGNFGLYKGKPVVLDGIVIPRKPGTIKINTDIPGIPQHIIDRVNTTNSNMDWIISNGHYPEFRKKGGKINKSFVSN